MKFGSKLESFLIPEWADKYIRYKYLNRLIKAAYRFRNLGEFDQNDDGIRLQEELFSLNPHPYNDADSDNRRKSPETATPGNASPSQTSRSNPELEHEFVAVTIPDDESKVGPEGKLDSIIRPVSHPHLESIQSEDLPEVIKIVADSFAEHGHLNFEDIPLLRKASTYSKAPSSMEVKARKSLNKLEIMHLDSSISLRDTPPNLDQSDPSETPESDHNLPGFENELPNQSYNLIKLAPKTKGHAKKFPFRNLSMFRHFTPLKTELVVTTPRKRQFRGKEGSPDSLALFNKALRDDIRMVVMHYSSEMQYILVLINYLRKDILNRSGTMDQSYVKLVQKAITALWDSCDKLNSYLNTNILAVYKLLKKKDKLLETNDLTTLYPRYKEVFLSVDNFKDTNESILSLYRLVSEPSNVDFDKIKQDVEASLDTHFKPAYYLYYIMGLCTVLFAINVVMCAADFGVHVRHTTIVSQLPIFRVSLVFGILWYGIGWCQNYLETYGVNYQFLFNMSNNYSVSDRDLYFFGSLQTFLCLVIFCIFLLDCKISLFGDHDLHYIYPIVLIVCSIAIVLVPKRSFKLKLRRRMLVAILRSFTSPICVGPPVSLSDSILADLYTSLTRAFVDIIYIFSYFAYGAPRKCNHMHPVLTTWVVPTVMILPFFLRFAQCLRRYINEHLWLQVGNMLKYLSGIVCVVVSSLKWLKLTPRQRLALIVTCYVVATLYNFLWDYFIDWGLSLPLDIFKRRGGRKMYKNKAYYMACVANLLCRFTWALTVTPFQLMEDREISLNIIILIISLVEIFRRVVWVTFRLETEHLLNSYKYRTALWVPKLYKCKSVIVKELKILNE